MEPRRKDNLTDLVEGLPKEPAGEANSSKKEPGNQEVTTEDGEVVILGHKRPSPLLANNRVIPLELSESDSLVSALRSAFLKALDQLFKKHEQNKGKSPE